MGKKILMLTWITICFAVAAAAANKKFTLVIDAGHGGHDAGARGSFSYEKNINLNVALAFGRYVERNCPDVKVVYTRKTDVFIPLHTRADIANKNKADLFVSIHTNALPGGKISRGMETYTLGMHRAGDNFDVAKRENSVILIEKDYKQHYEGFDPNSSESYIMFEFMQDKNMEQSVEMARLVQKHTCTLAGRQNKGVKQAGFLVLRETSMPSCLIELGFITTADEERFLNSENGIDAMGKGIYQAFASYKKKYDTNITVPYQAETKRKIRIPSVVPEDDKKPSKKEQQPQKEKEKEKQDQPEPAANSADTQSSPEKAPDSADAAQQDNQKAAEESQQQEQTGEVKNDEPVFKVQILANNRRLRPDSQQLKGLTDVDFYEENNLYKYTIGASTDYNEIYKLRKSLLSRFPEAFIIAFKAGQKVDVVGAIREFKNNKNKK